MMLKKWVWLKHFDRNKPKITGKEGTSLLQPEQVGCTRSQIRSELSLKIDANVKSHLSLCQRWTHLIPNGLVCKNVSVCEHEECGMFTLDIQLSGRGR